MALPTVLTWLLASFATAALSHALIGFLGVAGSGGSYDEHDHARWRRSR